jgi:hypothetical protein
MTNALLEFAIGFAAFMAGWYAMQMASVTAATNVTASGVSVAVKLNPECKR